MDLSKIITVPGKPGLHRIVAQGRKALIVEALEDGKRAPVHLSVQVSALEEIRIFTTGDDVPLADVLKKLHEVEKGGPSIDPKEDPEKLFAKLGEALPDHDRERIYPSDLRKLFTWYGQLLKAGEFEAKAEEKEEEEAAAAPEGEKAKAAKKAPAKEGAPKKPKTGSGAKKAAAPKPPASSKAKATTMRKSAQRGS